MKFRILRTLCVIILVVLFISVCLFITESWNRSFYYSPGSSFREPPILLQKSENTDGLNKHPEIKQKLPTSAKFHHYIADMNGDCPDVTFSSWLARDDTWFPVDETHTVYVFSAYNDVLEPNAINILGAKLSGRGNYFCQLWYKSTDDIFVVMKHVPATIFTYPEGHGRRYTACKLSCKVESSVIPVAVSIVDKKCASPLNLLPVYQQKNDTYESNFTICVSPFYFEYGRAYELVEWIELNRILGVDRFVFYDFSTGSNVLQVLEEYTKQGLVDMVPWKLPMKVSMVPGSSSKDPTEIHYYGQLAFINDCLLRNRLRTKYLAYLNVDEFIIPHSDQSKTWTDMLNELPTSPAYIFRNTFFRKEWNNSSDFKDIDLAKQWKLVTLLKIEHESQIFPPFQKTKYIIRPKEVDFLGINSPRLKGNKRPFIVPVNTGLLHHYRNWETYDDSKERVKDDIVRRKYQDVLLKHVEKIWSDRSHVKRGFHIN